MSSRFPIHNEIRKANIAFTDAVAEWGTYVLWFRYYESASEIDDVYDEHDFDSEIAWHPPRKIPALNIVTYQGGETKGEGGFYSTDTMRATFSAEHIRRQGLPDINKSTYLDRDLLKDRLVYDGILWSPTAINFAGNVQDVNLVIGIVCEEIDPDEVRNDPTFEEYVRDKT